MATKRKPTTTERDIAAARNAARKADIAAGIKHRAVTFPDRRAIARKKACRGPYGPD